jgi:hypothetical protein
MIEPREAFPVNIDFDESIAEWNRNKRKLPNGLYRYICTGMFKNGRPCNRAVLPFTNACRIHVMPETDTSTIPEQSTSVEIGSVSGETPKAFHIENTSEKTAEKEVRRPNTRSAKHIIEPEPAMDLDPETRVHVNSPKSKKPSVLGNSRRNLQILGRNAFGGSYRELDMNIRQISRLFWHYCTLKHSIVPECKDEDADVPISRIDVYTETIYIQTKPIICSSFSQIRNAIYLYRSIDRIDTPEKIRENRYDIKSVIYNLQLILSFLEGLGDLTKMETKHEIVMELKTGILMFFGYDVHTHLNTTKPMWANTSLCIQKEIMDVMGVLFGQFPRNVV